MSSVTLRRDRRRNFAVLLAVLLLASAIADLRLAIIFSPILLLAALISADRRVEEAIIDLVHGLAAGRPHRRPRRTAALPTRVDTPNAYLGIRSLSSRAPPRFAH